MNMVIAEKIKMLREARHMTQNELADIVGVTGATISAYEVSSRMPSYEVLIRIAQLFRVSTDYLLGLNTKQSVDISKLNNQQKTVVQEIVALYEHKNVVIQELVQSGGSRDEMIDSGYINEFDIAGYRKNQEEE